MFRPLFIMLVLSMAWSHARAEEELSRREWTVDGVAREAMVHVPLASVSGPRPLVFAFHGHGGTMTGFANRFAIHRKWPEAIVVYPQGLNTPGRITDKEGKRPGWQATFGDQNDRDLAMFDAVLASLQKEGRVDDRRIYVTGHSNGGAFTYLLLAARGDKLAAVAPCAAPALPEFKDKLRPRPLFHLAGENDPIVKFEWQKKTIDSMRTLNGCGDGRAWDTLCTIYESSKGTPVVTYIHNGRHEVPAAAAGEIVKFFQLFPAQ